MAVEIGIAGVGGDQSVECEREVHRRIVAVDEGDPLAETSLRETARWGCAVETTLPLRVPSFRLTIELIDTGALLKPWLLSVLPSISRPLMKPPGDTKTMGCTK